MVWTSVLILSTVAWTLADFSCSSSVSTEMMLIAVPFARGGATQVALARLVRAVETSLGTGSAGGHGHRAICG